MMIRVPMRNTRSLVLAILALAACSAVASAKHDHANPDSGDGLVNTTVLIIRHAEKPDDGPDLSAAGNARALAYVNYFQSFMLDGRPARPVALFATAPSAGSNRPVETLTPLARALGVTIDERFPNKDSADLVRALHAAPHGSTVLICWHHGQVPTLLRALGVDAETLLPQGKWPSTQFGWVLALRFDATGQLVGTQRIAEHLMPGGSD